MYDGATELGKKNSDEETLTRSTSFQLEDVTRLCASGDAGGKPFQSGLPEAAGLPRADGVRRRPSFLPHIHLLGKHLCHCWSGTLGVEVEEAATSSHAGRAGGSCCRCGARCRPAFTHVSTGAVRCPSSARFIHVLQRVCHLRLI